MSPQPSPGTETEPLDDVEEVTAEPVADADVPPARHPAPRVAELADGPGRARGRGLSAGSAGQVAVQAAAVAATGLVAGAATTALVRAARGRRGTGRGTKGAGRTRDGVDVLETRTYVVDVHVLGRR